LDYKTLFIRFKPFARLFPQKKLSVSGRLLSTLARLGVLAHPNVGEETDGGRALQRRPDSAQPVEDFHVDFRNARNVRIVGRQGGCAATDGGGDLQGVRRAKTVMGANSGGGIGQVWRDPLQMGNRDSSP
jgi:hypothetical protein